MPWFCEAQHVHGYACMWPVLVFIVRHELYLTFTTLWADSADDKLMIFLLFFLREKVLIFHANCSRLYRAVSSLSADPGVKSSNPSSAM